MVRGAAIGFVVSILLTTVAAWLMSTGAVHAQQGPQHVFSGYVSNHRQPLNEGFVRVFIGQAHEVASGDIRQGRYKLAVVQPAGDYFSGRTLRFVVVYQGIEYERPGQIGWQAGRTNEENFDIEGWQWQGQPQRLPNQPQNDGGMNANQQARFEMERERMEREEEMRREEDQERRQMERDRMEREEERQRDREDRDAEMRQDEQQSRRSMEEDMRREQMEMERERMERGQPGVRPVAGGSPKSGPSRGLFSNRAAGEATSGIDNIMDPTMLTIIGIALTVFTTGMTLFKSN